MHRDQQDIYWGGVLALLGLLVAAYAWMHYDLGDLRRMGPGFFPVVLGVILVALGARIGFTGWHHHARVKVVIAYRELIGILAALLLFAILLEGMGLIVAAAVAVFTASSVAPRPGLLWKLALTAIVTLLTYLIFITGLNMTLPVWPSGT